MIGHSLVLRAMVDSNLVHEIDLFFSKLYFRIVILTQFIQSFSVENLCNQFGSWGNWTVLFTFSGYIYIYVDSPETIQVLSFSSVKPISCHQAKLISVPGY